MHRDAALGKPDVFHTFGDVTFTITEELKQRQARRVTQTPEEPGQGIALQVAEWPDR